MPVIEPRKITTQEWQREGAERFGNDQNQWQFVCPNCGHIQTIDDFRELKAKKIAPDVVPSMAYYSCIGRYDKRIPKSKIGTFICPKEYCDYTLGGLIPLNKTTIVDDEDQEHRVFEFAEVT